ETTMSIAEGMETALLNMWRGEKQLSEDAGFKLLKLDEEGDKLFQNPLVNTWASYVKMLGTGSDKSIFLTLKARYGEGDLAQMLLKKSESTGPLAARLEYAQRNSWITEGKTADDIFKLLNVQKQNEKLLESPLYHSWTSYVAGVERGDSDEVVASELKTHYGEKDLTSMLDAAKGNPSTKSVATRLQEEL
ncbi:hypothetical protein PHYSODRAFT_497933, partial [Phytophthora sojae]